MKIATWNVNSLRVRLPQVIEWLAQQPVDILGLQELKLAQEHFPIDALAEAGWQAEWQGQPTYNGVALISSCAATEVQGNLPNFEDPQQRVIAATYATDAGPLRVINAYCPNGQDLSSDKFLYKLNWYEAFHSWLAEQLALYPLLVVMGDYNIAPADADVHDPKAWEGKVHVSPQERAAFQKLLDLGLHDAFRLFEQEEKSYTWWDYRSMAFRRNAGLRIDHILVSTALLPHTTACFIDKSPRRNERPSDHTPCVVELNLLPQS
ncbi:MAG TPA: exodeoxyribonuclease III [Candidatus Paenalcaligenes intestinipullorum]|uniref:Exodeoxyribonuclease III n=1 Tax=Candidatus Paenalcaligenes intestinipullorum TaxID=2838718 RepID=A0A9D2U7C8_9BURK|nr:exodeoxyribonuclease III [Candidatus Paenalcaligenes intestinipullorum]